MSYIRKAPCLMWLAGWAAVKVGDQNTGIQGTIRRQVSVFFYVRVD